MEVEYVAKRNRATTEEKQSKWIDQGRGLGHGADYQPWLTIQDVPSNGRVTRVKGWKTGRTHHLMSSLETAYFYTAEWADSVTDIREQYPLLPIERTLEIAMELGIKHPTDPKTKVPTVITTDFVLTINNGEDEVREIARTIKPASKLTKRQLDKFRIEHRFHKEQGRDWGIVTDLDLPKVLPRNMEFIHNHREISTFTNLSMDDVESIAATIFAELLKTEEPISKVALNHDRYLAVNQGTTANLVKYKIANKHWKVDMINKNLNLSKYCLSELLVEEGNVSD